MNMRHKWIDQARGLALLFVVIGHMGIPYFGQFFTTVHLPLFFFLSGLTFSAHQKFATFIKAKAKRLLIPYVCLSIPLLLSSFIGCAAKGITDVSSYWRVVYLFLLQRRWLTVWFLTCLFLASLLLYAIIKATKNRSGWILGTCIVTGVAGLCYWEFGGIKLPWNLDAAFVAVMFMGVGYCAEQTDWVHKKESFRSWIAFLGTAGIYVVCVAINGFVVGEKFDMAMCWGGLIPVSLLAIFCGIYCILFLCKHMHFSVLEYLGQNTMVYFAWHQSIVLPLLLNFYNLVGWFQSDTLILDAIRTVLTVVLIFLILWPVDILFRKTKLRVAIGK